MNGIRLCKRLITEISLIMAVRTSSPGFLTQYPEPIFEVLINQNRFSGVEASLSAGILRILTTEGQVFNLDSSKVDGYSFTNYSGENLRHIEARRAFIKASEDDDE